MATYYIDFEHDTNSGDGLSFANRKNSYHNLSLSAGDEVRIKKSPDATSLGNGAVVRDYSNQSYNPGSLSASNVVFSTTTGQTKINLDAYIGNNYGTRNGDGYTWQTGDKILIIMCDFPEGKNINGVWEIELEGSNSDYVYLKGFTASNADSESGNTMKYISVTTETIKLASWPCKEIASSKGGRSAWTASSGVTTTLKGDGTVDSSWSAWNQRYDWIHPTGSDSIQIPSGHSGKVAYYATGDLNLSAYQQISCLIQFRTTPGNYDVGQAGQFFSLRLCTDTSGDTSVHTIPIQNIGRFNQYPFIPYVYDLGTNLNSSIKSIALYADNTTNTTNLLRFCNIVACKASSSADSLTHNSLISLNTTADRAWFPVLHLTDNQNLLTLLTFHRAYGSNGLGYYSNYMGVTWSQTFASTTIYKREPIRPKWLIDYTSTGSTQTLNGNGTEGNYITVSGGWDDTDMSSSSSSSKTFIRGNGNGYGIRTSNCSYIDVSKIHTTCFFYNNLYSNNGAKYRDIGFSDVGQDHSISGTNILEANIEYATAARNNGMNISNFKSPNANISDVNFYYCRAGALSGRHFYSQSNSEGNIGLIDCSLAPFQTSAVAFSYHSNPMTINRIKCGGSKGEYALNFPDNVSNVTINNLDMERSYYGIYFNTLFGNIIIKNITHSIEFDFASFYTNSYYYRYVNNSDHRFQASTGIRIGSNSHTGLIDGGNLLKSIYSLTSTAVLKVKNLVLPTSGTQIDLNGDTKLLFKNYNNVSGDDRNVWNYGELRPESTIRHTNSGLAWRMVSNPYSTLDSNITLIIDLGKVIVNSGSLVTIAIWTYKTASGATGFLRIAKNDELGMTSYVQADTSSNSLNTWVKITTTFTPTASGLATIQIGGYGSQSTEYIYFDDLEVSQA